MVVLCLGRTEGGQPNNEFSSFYVDSESAESNEKQYTDKRKGIRKGSTENKKADDEQNIKKGKRKEEQLQFQWPFDVYQTLFSLWTKT